MQQAPALYDTHDQETVDVCQEHIRNILMNVLLIAFGTKDQLGAFPGTTSHEQEWLAFLMTPETRARIDVGHAWNRSCLIATSLLVKSNRALPPGLAEDGCPFALEEIEALSEESLVNRMLDSQ